MPSGCWSGWASPTCSRTSSTSARPTIVPKPAPGDLRRASIAAHAIDAARRPPSSRTANTTWSPPPRLGMTTVLVGPHAPASTRRLRRLPHRQPWRPSWRSARVEETSGMTDERWRRLWKPRSRAAWEGATRSRHTTQRLSAARRWRRPSSCSTPASCAWPRRSTATGSSASGSRRRCCCPSA